MIKPYNKNGKKLYEVAVYKKDSKKKQHSRKKRGITSERKAREIEFQLKNELYKLVTGGFIRWNWKQWYEECIKRMRLYLKKSTIQNYDGKLKKWIPQEFQELSLGAIKTQNVHELIFETIGERASLHCQKAVLKMIKRIFTMAVEEGIIARNPSLSIQVKAPKSQKKVLNSKEVIHLLDEAFKCNHRFYKIWAFALMTGMRSGEMFALCWQDIDFETGFISVNKQWTSKDGIAHPKNRESRIIPINEDLRSFLKKLKSKKEAYSQEFWDSRSKTKVTFDDLVLPRSKEWEHGEQAQILREFCKAIGITSIRFHDLRATFITNMLAQGVPLVQVMAIVGHRKMSTTDEYLRLAGVSINGATERISYHLPQARNLENVFSLLSGFKNKP